MPSFRNASDLNAIFVRLDRLTETMSLFGQLSNDEWGVLGYRHLDHHLRQFGV